jgi:uracil-DNA glycosylase
MQTARPELGTRGRGGEEASSEGADERAQNASRRAAMGELAQTDHLLHAEIAPNQQPREIPEVIVPLSDHPKRDFARSCALGARSCWPKPCFDHSHGHCRVRGSSHSPATDSRVAASGGGGLPRVSAVEAGNSDSLRRGAAPRRHFSRRGAQGDREDVEGRPFVGPAGRLLDVCLERAGIDRAKVYVTNVVKHFKWEPKGKKRIHQKPNSSEIAACRPWLEAEIAVVRPKALVCLGATAAQAIFGRSFRVTKSRGRILASTLAPLSAATVHPSSILRAPDLRTRHLETERFVRDLAQVARALKTREH